MHRCIALSCLLVKALSVYLKVYFLSIVHILCKFNRFSRGGRIFSVFGCNYFFILGVRVLPIKFHLVLISATNYISCSRIRRVNFWSSHGVLLYFSFLRTSSAVMPDASSFFSTASVSTFLATSAAFLASSFAISFSVCLISAFCGFRLSRRDLMSVFSSSI